MELRLSAAMADTAGLSGEQALVERAKRDREAFAELYRRHYRAIARYVYRRVGDPHTTEDLVADSFMLAMTALPRFRNRGVPVRAWLYRIASNRVNRWARQARRRATQTLDAERADPKAAPMDARMTRGFARAALLTLSPKYQTVLALHYLEGMTVADVALATGCRVGTVKSRLARGRDALRRRLQQRRSQL